MIELCTVRRMVVTILFLGIVTIISVMIETKYEPNNKSITNSRTQTSQKVLTEEVAENESFDCPDEMVTTVCKPCASWHRAMDEEGCETGYLKEVKCLDNKVKYMSCEEPSYVRRRSFLVHEGVWLVVGIFSYLFVHFRRSALDQKVLDRVNKQIASGV
ncbi:protein JTB-like isoform X1 [Watersipora subatra]|uniref:protein JTB-like isoform X1 n=1 Tax=Watersipora subatra TaxID=2589382 RepID=UPI00355AFD55